MSLSRKKLNNIFIVTFMSVQIRKYFASTLLCKIVFLSYLVYEVNGILKFLVVNH